MTLSVTFFSNFFNAHQLPVAERLAGADGIDYTFVSVVRTNGMAGRACLDDSYPYILKAYSSEADKTEAMRHAVEDDMVVFGELEGHEEYVAARAKTGRPFFRFTERILKRGDWWRFAPPKVMRTRKRFLRYSNSNMYVLCGGAYAAHDLALSGFPKDKCLKWGYFPVVDCGCVGARPAGHQRYLSLCSAQRQIPFKRVDMQIELARLLKRDGYEFRLKIAGDGPELPRLKSLASEYSLNDSVEFLGLLAPDCVAELMHESDLFLATSDRSEGWGATINEAMACGCCVVASDAMGSVPYLVEDGATGLRFRSGSIESLYSSVTLAVDDSGLRDRCGVAARILVTKGEWSAYSAADRLLSFSRAWLDAGAGFKPPFACGPLSNA